MANPTRGHLPAETETEIHDADWDSQDLSGQRHSRVAFIDADLTEATSTGAVFEMCTFRNVKLNASRHTDSAFVNCTFTGSSLFDATFTGCKFVGSTFTRCNFAMIKVTGGGWSFVDLAGADLSRTSGCARRT